MLFDALSPLVAGRVYPDTAPPGVEAMPRITYYQVGGVAINFLESVPPNRKNGRFQIHTWGGTRLQVAALSRLVEDTLVLTSALYTTVLAAPVSIYEPELRLYGARQDFSFWF